MTRALASYELEIPAFFDPAGVVDRRTVDYLARQAEAVAWARKHGLKGAALDRTRIAFMPIDTQLTFCHPNAALFVAGRSGTGAVDDSVRTAEFIYRNLGVITRIFPTMDTHTTYQIFHPAFIIDENGEHPGPATMITLDEVKAGKWKPNPAVAHAVLGNPQTLGFVEQYFVHYVEQLTRGGKYPLMVWPYHAMLGDVDHALVPGIQEALFFHEIARGSQAKREIKGGNPLTENYSVLRPEVLEDHKGRAIAQKNTKFLETLLAYDALIIAGQAKSHCVAWAIQDLIDEIQAQDPELAKKVYLVEDLTSPVVIPGVYDFTDDADAAFQKFADAGMHVVQSTTPIADWEGVDLKL